MFRIRVPLSLQSRCRWASLSAVLVSSLLSNEKKGIHLCPSHQPSMPTAPPSPACPAEAVFIIIIALICSLGGVPPPFTALASFMTRFWPACCCLSCRCCVCEVSDKSKHRSKVRSRSLYMRRLPTLLHLGTFPHLCDRILIYMWHTCVFPQLLHVKWLFLLNSPLMTLPLS